jgi:hypothetical protein
VIPLIRAYGAALLTAGLLAAGAAPASAAKPLTLDGRTQTDLVEDPAVAVDGQGTGHIVWRERGANGDLVHYCQVPRNARACARHLTLAAEHTDFGGPRVLVPGDGRILVVTGRCCFRGDPARTSRLFLFASTDNGASFAGPLHIGDNAISGDARLGPGLNSISTITDVTTGGVRFQTAPLAGPPPGPLANLGEIPGNVVGAAYNGSIAFPDPINPIVVMDDLDHVYLRRFAGGTAYNDPAAWTPRADLGPGAEPRLAGLPSGRGGVHLLMRVGSPGKRRYVARRYKNQTFPGPSVPVSEKGDPVFREFFMDAGARLHALWVNNEEDSLQHRAARTGNDSWKDPEALIGPRKAGNVFNIRADAASDGGGFAVYDANGKGPIRAVPFGPKGPVAPGGGEGGCVDSLKVGGATVVAPEGCLTRAAGSAARAAAAGGRYTTSGHVRVNGIDLFPQGGATITLDTGARTLKTSGAVEAKVGNVVLGRQALEWFMPAGNGPIMRDAAGNPATFDTGKLQVEVLGLPVSGQTTPTITGDGKVEIPVHLALPNPFDALAGGVTTDFTLRSSNDGGFVLNGAELKVKNAFIGIAEVKDFSLLYKNEDPWILEGATDIVLPVTGGGLAGAFRLRDGALEYGKFELDFTGTGIAIAPYVFLKRVRLGVQSRYECERPAKIEGGLTLAVIQENIARVDGDAFYEFPRQDCPDPSGRFRIQGNGYIAEMPVAEFFVQYKTSGQVTFGGNAHIDIGPFSGQAGLSGGIDGPTDAYYLHGTVGVGVASHGEGEQKQEFSLVGADVITSSVGVRGCTTLIGIGSGFHKYWGGDGGVDWPWEGCEGESEDFVPAVFKSARASQAASASFDVPRGTPAITVRVRGGGTPPQVTLEGPGGRRIATARRAHVGKDVAYGTSPGDNRTYVRLARPAAGRWRVVAQPGSTIAGVETARGLPQPKVTAHVRRAKRGRKRVLSYDVKRLPGQVVRFVEQGRDTTRVLRTVKRGGKGKIAFTPGAGQARGRTIVAEVESGGIPRRSLRVARYTAPPQAKPFKPRDVRIRRRNGRLVVTYGRSRGAARYAVYARLKDGRRTQILTRKRRVVIPNVPGIDSGSILVAGLRRDNVAGPSAKADFKAKPKKLTKRKRKRARR